MEPFRTIESRRIHEGRVLNLRVDTLDVGSGRTVHREVVEHIPVAVIAALDSKGRVLLVRQYRHPVGEWLLELPAGGLDPGEDPQAAARRELQEETGFYPGRLERVGGFYSAPGFTDEFLHLYIARELRPQPLKADVDEEIEVVPTSLGQVRELLLSGEIKDAKSIAGLLTLLLLLEREPDGKGPGPSP